MSTTLISVSVVICPLTRFFIVPQTPPSRVRVVDFQVAEVLRHRVEQSLRAVDLSSSIHDVY